MAETPPPAPPASATDIQYLKGFSFFWNDPGFKNNILIGSVHMLIPIVGPIVLMGWYCEIIQRLVRRHPKPIPKLDFTDFGHYLGRGVIPFLVSFLTTLPVVVVLYVAIFGFIVVMAVLAEQRVQEFALIGIGVTGASVVFLGILLPAMVLVHSFLTFAELTEDFGQAMNFSRVWAYAKRNWPKILTAQLIFIPVGFGGMIVGMLACYVGIFPVSLMINIAFLYVRWQVYENDLRRGGPALPIKPERPIPSEQRAAAVLATPTTPSTPSTSAG